MEGRRFCENCGAAWTEGAAFCVRCGAQNGEAVGGVASGRTATGGALNRAEEILSEEGIRKCAETAGVKFREFTGIERLEGFSLSALLAEVFKRHTPEAAELRLGVGTPRTTPAIEEVDASWPRPWMFFRALMGSVLVYFLFVCALEWFENIYLIPGLILSGSMAIPLSILLFFFEMNARRNVSLYRMFKLVFLGGILSLIFSLILYSHSLSLQTIAWVGPPIAGIIEEAGKLGALIVLARSTKYHYRLNGLLLGACVGAGFEIFESAGYALEALVSEEGGVFAMNANIVFRGIFSPFGSHIMWTAICGHALWRVKGAGPFRLSMLADGRFWHLAIISVILHALWNSGLQLPFLANYLILGVIVWIVVLALIQEGLKELRAEQSASRQQEATDSCGEGDG